MTELKIGVIGSGGRGKLAAYAHQPGEGSRIVACCDLSTEILQKNCEDYGGDLFTTNDYQELLKQDLDAVFITVPDFLHEEVALKVLNAGKAVYLEKPMAITTEGCDRILEAARDSQSRLYVGHNMRHMPFVAQMKELIDIGTIGRVRAVWCRHFVGHGGDAFFKDWHAERQYSNGLLLQKGAHDIDVIHWLSNGYSRVVNALGGLTVYGVVQDRLMPSTSPRTRLRTGNLPNPHRSWPPLTQTGLNSVIDVEDISMMQMQLDNGVYASYQQCHYTPDYWRSYTVIGDEGRMENFGNGEDGTCIKVWNNRKMGYHAPDDVHMVGAATGGHGGADPVIVAEFLRFARTGGQTTTSPLAARYSVAAGCAATDSLRHGGTPMVVPRVSDETATYFEQSDTSAASV
jgi:predicted dehydrogenase